MSDYGVHNAALTRPEASALYPRMRRKKSRYTGIVSIRFW